MRSDTKARQMKFNDYIRKIKQAKRNVTAKKTDEIRCLGKADKM